MSKIHLHEVVECKFEVEYRPPAVGQDGGEVMLFTSILVDSLI